jgi:cation diffusion facilitator CzcD-associated flavoprotein CzcO
MFVFIWEMDAKKRDYSGKTVALIGIGSLAFQILPQRQKKCRRVDYLVRGGTWISEPFADEETQDKIVENKDSGNCLSSTPLHFL